MIRTSIVLSPRQNAGERLYLQANGLPVDMTVASRSVVMTSHRPTQLYIASHGGQRQAAPTLTAQTGISGQHMQRLMDLLDRQGSDVLARLCQDGELRGEWLVAIDENRLNAVISERFQFYLFRAQRLRELRPVGQISMAVEPAAIRPASAGPASEPGWASWRPGDPSRNAQDPAAGPSADAAEPAPEDSAEPATRPMNHFRIEIRQDDQVLVMPRGLIPQPLLTEAELVLQGMQQLPDRLSSLIIRLRERGVTMPANGWLAVQVLRTMTEYVATDRSQRPRLSGRRKGGDADADPGYSEELVDLDAASARGGSSGGRRGFGRSGRSAAAGAAAGASSAAAGALSGSETAVPGSAAHGDSSASDSASAGTTSAASQTGSANPGRAASGGSVAPYRATATSSQTAGTARSSAAGRPGILDERRESGPAGWLRHPVIRVLLLALLLALLAGGTYLAYRAIRPGARQPDATTTIGTTAAATSIATTARSTPTVSPAPTTTATTAPRVAWYVISRRLNVRTEPSSSSKLIRTLTIGQPLYVIDQANKDWTRIQTAEGETGYVFTAYISKNKPAG